MSTQSGLVKLLLGPGLLIAKGDQQQPGFSDVKADASASGSVGIHQRRGRVEPHVNGSTRWRSECISTVPRSNATDGQSTCVPTYMHWAARCIFWSAAGPCRCLRRTRPCSLSLFTAGCTAAHSPPSAPDDGREAGKPIRHHARRHGGAAFLALGGVCAYSRNDGRRRQAAQRRGGQRNRLRQHATNSPCPGIVPRCDGPLPGGRRDPRRHRVRRRWPLKSPMAVGMAAALATALLIAALWFWIAAQNN